MHHHVGRGETANSDNGFGGQCLEPAHIGFLAGFRSEAGGHRVVLPAAQDEVPQIGVFADHADHVLDLSTGDAVIAEEFVDGDTAGDSCFPIRLLAGVFEYLAQESDPVGQAAAVFVGAVVVPPRQEVVQAAHGVSGVGVDDVVTDVDGAANRVAVPPAHIGDIGLGHRSRLHRVVIPGHDGKVLRSKWDFATDQVRTVEPVVGEFDTGQRAALVNHVGDPGQPGQILLVPDPQFDERPDIGRGVDLNLFGADHSPTSFGLHPAHVGLAGGIPVAHAVAVRYLVEAVTCRHRADLYRLEEDVVARIAHMSSCRVLGVRFRIAYSVNR